MSSSEVNGTELFYEEVGHGPTCLVLHGWPGVDHSYLRGLDPLSSHLRLAYYDHRCHGRSARADLETLTVEQLADDAAALGETLAGHPPLVLGHHHGASVAVELAIRHPQAVSGLILVAASPGELGATESLADAFFDPVATPPEVEILQRVPPNDDGELAATMQALTKFFFCAIPPVDVFASTVFNAAAAVRFMQVMSFWSAVDRLGAIGVPVLVVTGAHDLFCPPPQARRIATRVARAQTLVLEKSGHVPWLEEPDAFVDSVLEWLPGLKEEA